MIEKRIRKMLRQKGVLKGIKNATCFGDLAFDVASSISRIPFKKDKQVDMNADFFDQVHSEMWILPWTADHENEIFVRSIMEGNFPSIHIGDLPNVIKLFISCSDDEIKRYASVKGLQFKKCPNTVASEFIQHMTEKFPQTSFMMAKSVREITKQKYF